MECGGAPPLGWGSDNEVELWRERGTEGSLREKVGSGRDGDGRRGWV